MPQMRQHQPWPMTGEPRVVFARCRRGCRYRLVIHAEKNYHGDDVLRVNFRDGTSRVMLLPEAIPYLAECDGIEAGTPHGLLYGKPLKVYRTEAPCDDRCTHATSGTCRCSCGGINHGIEA